MRYTKYRIIKEDGLYHIEIPSLFWSWRKLCGYNQHSCYYLPLKFTEYQEALSYAEDHKYSILHTS